MKIVDSNNVDLNKLIVFCKDAIDDSIPGSVNLDTVNWENKPHTLLHTLIKEKRFNSESRSNYLLLEKGDHYIAGSGFYPLKNDHNVCILSTRTYVIKTERGKLLNGYFLLPEQIKLAKELNYKSLILTFNEYNLWLKKSIHRASFNQSKFAGLKIPDSYKNWKPLDYPVTIQYTKQWCLYQHLDDSYDNKFKQSMADICSD